MKTLLVCWFAACSAFVVIPSTFMAIGVLDFMNNSPVHAGHDRIFAMATFFTTALAVAFTIFCPAIIVLTIGIVTCLVLRTLN